MSGDDGRAGGWLEIQPDSLVARTPVGVEKPVPAPRLEPLSLGTRRPELLLTRPAPSTGRSLPIEHLPARREASLPVLPEISDLPGSLHRPLDTAALSPLSRRLREA